MKKFSLWRWSRSPAEHEPLKSEEAGEQVMDSLTLEGEGKRFGIKSYLHHFYLSSPTVEELENPSAWYLLPPPPAQRMSVCVCRAITFIGLLLLLAGAGLIIIGYTWKPGADFDAELTRISVTQNDEGDFYIDREHLDQLLHPINDKWRLAGFIVFALGAAIVAISLLIPSCVHFFFASSKHLPFSGDNTPNEPPVRVYPSMGGSRFKVSKLSGPHKISPTSSSSPVPAMQEITSVQPGAKRSAVSTPTADDLLLATDTDSLLR